MSKDLDRISKEKELLESLKKGSKKAFSDIYNLYWKSLLAISFRHLKDKELSENVVQEVFISLWNRREVVEINSLEAYLATAVKFYTLKVLNQIKRHEDIEKSLEFPDATIDEQIETSMLKEYLNSIVEKLPEKCKLVFKLSREDQLSNHEISNTLNISEKTVEAHITRALKVLRINLLK